MIDKYRLEDMRRESGEKGELARWVIQLQTDLDSERRKAGNSPVIPDGWQLVPKEPTEAMNKSGWAAMNEHDAINPTYRAMLAAAPQHEVKK